MGRIHEPPQWRSAWVTSVTIVSNEPQVLLAGARLNQSEADWRPTNISRTRWSPCPFKGVSEEDCFAITRGQRDRALQPILLQRRGAGPRGSGLGPFWAACGGVPNSKSLRAGSAR